MGWDRGGYYSRSRRENGRVKREYLGKGEVGAIAAHLDLLDREARAAERETDRARRAEMEALDRPIEALDELADLLTEAALVAAGYHRHKRGEWRKRRGRECDP